ncbi:MAG: hypothetical protein KBT33_06755 [Prevotellaceae bacterium]|nr:hypothetical protein [Candidatus Minthosoma equi]
MPKPINPIDQRTIQGNDNRCGGYCMDVLLYELNFHQQFKPGITYNEMLQEQERSMNYNSLSYTFVDNSIFNGTKVLLPSTIAKRASSFADRVCVLQEQGVRFPQNLIQEENDKINNFAHEKAPDTLVDHIQVVQSINAVIRNAPNNTFYFVVLDNGNNTYHWNLVKIENGTLHCYNTNGIWTQGFPINMMGVAIEIKPKH